MTNTRLRFAQVIGITGLLALTVGLVGCPLFRSGDTKLTTVLTVGDASTTQKVLAALLPKKAPLDIQDVDKLVVTVTQITLHRACEGQCPGDDPAVVEVSDFEFDPADITVGTGTTVRWLWMENGAHTVTSGEFGDTDAGTLFNLAFDAAGDFGDVGFNTAGLYTYFSEPDVGEGMTGTVEVIDDICPCLNRVSLLDEPLDVDLKNLTAISEVLSYAEVPSGKYTKIVLAITNPRLYLAADPETAITDVKLTANGRLFISEQFVLPAGGPSLLLLEFDGIHLVKQGNGRYNLTPQLRADVEVQAAEAYVTGTVLEINAQDQLLTLQLAGGELVVNYSQAQVFLPTDTTAPTGSPTDLAAGLSVEVEGQLRVDGVLAADVIYIASVP